MGLLMKEVKATLNSATINYYENLGYNIPKTKDKYGRLTVKRGTKITVDVKDLPLNSSIKVDVKCDNCKEIRTIPYSKYTKHNREGVTYCYKCAIMFYNSGENCYKWNSNKTNEERLIRRNYPEYHDFVRRVFKRDKYICQCCGKLGNGDLVAHHLNGYNWYIEGRTDETNGITLCDTCHSNFHSIYGTGNNTKEQFEEWIGKSIDLLKYIDELPKSRKIICLETQEIFDGSKDLCKKWGYKSYTGVNNKLTGRKPNSILGKHIMFLDEYNSLSQDEIEEYLSKNKIISRKRKVICTTNNKTFNSIAEASRYYNIYNKRLDISHCCSGRIKYVIDNEGNKLEWKYIEGGYQND